MSKSRLKVRAPGRICLFGEHQDYLGYPVIAGAIDRYIFINGTVLSESDLEYNSSKTQFIISMPDLENVPPKKISFPREEIQPFQAIQYGAKRDYLLSCINVAHRNGAKWVDSWDIVLNGTIPINAGASSSSAMVTAWLLFLFHAGKKEISPEELGEFGYISEVAEFDESGGMMDHFASSCGNVISVSSRPQFSAEIVRKAGPEGLNGFVLANSGVKKSTVDDLRNTKQRALSAFTNLKEIYPKFELFTTSLAEIEPYLSSLSKKEELIAYGNIKNRDLTLKGYELLKKMDIRSQKDQKILGDLLFQHHEMLSKNIGVSIQKIDEMVEIAMKAGAWGGKINGSGFGGTMFAYAPHCQDKVKEALENAGYNAWNVDISSGASVSSDSDEQFK